jgi:hypothetical protein
MITACDLDGGLRPTEDFVDAYTIKGNNLAVQTQGDQMVRYDNVPRDNTNFWLVVQTERTQSGYVFDGIDSK